MATVVAFIRLSRIKFLIGGVLGVALGTLVARFEGTRVDLHTVGIAQLAITSFQLMTHYSNDYFDRDCDVLAVRTPFSGGSGVLARNELTPAVALAASLCCLLAGTIALVMFGMHGNTTAVFIGCTIAALAWSYSSPPMRLLARGFGEVATALVVGSLVALFAFAAQTGRLDAVAVASTIPAACAMFIMMICVQIPDFAADSATGKRNLIVRLGTGAALPLVAVAAAMLVAGAAVAWLAGAPWLFAAAGLPPAALSMVLLRELRAPRGLPVARVARLGVAIFVLTLAAGVAAYIV